MVMTDPIADFLTRIRNANMQRHEKVEIPASKVKVSIAEILLEEGFIKNYDVTEDGKQGIVTVTLKYGPEREHVISGARGPWCGGNFHQPRHHDRPPGA